MMRIRRSVIPKDLAAIEVPDYKKNGPRIVKLALPMVCANCIHRVIVPGMGEDEFYCKVDEQTGVEGSTAQYPIKLSYFITCTKYEVLLIKKFIYTQAFNMKLQTETLREFVSKYGVDL